MPENTETPAASFDSDIQRHLAYQQEADPLFFKWQRGEATEQDWLDSVAAIQLRFPNV